MPGRLISDNALLSFECFSPHKLDISKAYDRVDWGCLEGILMKFGFDVAWVKKVMACVTSVRFSMRINGELTDTFKPSRGLRQGDPVSPYIFLFIAEGLSKILESVVHNQELRELKC